jgi:hypothetical protein
MGGKFEFSAQGSDLALFVGNETKVKIPSEINPPLSVQPNLQLGISGNLSEHFHGFLSWFTFKNVGC